MKNGGCPICHRYFMIFYILREKGLIDLVVTTFLPENPPKEVLEFSNGKHYPLVKVTHSKYLHEYGCMLLNTVIWSWIYSVHCHVKSLVSFEYIKHTHRRGGGEFLLIGNSIMVKVHLNFVSDWDIPFQMSFCFKQMTCLSGDKCIVKVRLRERLFSLFEWPSNTNR